jgi:hypothetical protein
MNLYDPYEKIRDWYKNAKNEFGAPRWYGLIVHMVDDVIVWTWEGKRIAEHHPNNNKYLVIPNKRLSAGIKTRWYSLLSCGDDTCMIDSTKKRRANGLVEWDIRFDQWTNETDAAAARRVRVRSGPIITLKGVQQRIQVHHADLSRLIVVGLSNADSDDLRVEKDKAKYTAFNKSLKKLKSVLYAQAKLGVFDEINVTGSFYSMTVPLREHVASLFGDGHRINHAELSTLLYDKVLQWIDSQDTDVVKDIAALCFYSHHSTEGVPIKRALNKINNGLSHVQTKYLRKECVTITESNKTPSLTNENKDRLVQPTD